jgi:hypothetical protein
MLMERIYYLDLRTLLEYLAETAAQLRTSLLIDGYQEHCEGFVFVKKGKILGCVIQTSEGKLLYEGQKVHELLLNSKQWFVNVDANVELAMTTITEHHRPLLSNRTLEQALRQKGRLDPSKIEAIPMKKRLTLRMVYSMVNGQRTSEQIKVQLQLPSALVDEAIEYLRLIDAIE